MPAPCKDCPFLKEGGVRGLRPERYQSIVDDVLSDKYFPCHKHVYEGATNPTCRGSLDFVYKQIGDEVFELQHVQMAERFKLWDVPDKKRQAKVWDSIEEIVEENCL